MYVIFRGRAQSLLAIRQAAEMAEIAIRAANRGSLHGAAGHDYAMPRSQ
jgi:hypothetical protein